MELSVTAATVSCCDIDLIGPSCADLRTEYPNGLLCQKRYMYGQQTTLSAIDHRTWKTGLPVRSAVLKPCAGRLVVGWVTTSEYLLLIVFVVFF